MAPLAGLHILDVGDTAHGDTAATQQVGIAQAAADQHFTAGGKIGPGNQLQ